MEIPLKRKYLSSKPGRRRGRGNYNGNSGVSGGKHTAHPDVHGYRRNGYKCEPKWNVHPLDDDLASPESWVPK